MTTISYFEAVETRLLVPNLAKEATGIEGYIVKKVIDVAALGLVFAVGSGRLAMPHFVTTFARQPLYDSASYLLGCKIGLGFVPVGVGIFAMNIYAPLNSDSVEYRNDWRATSLGHRLKGTALTAITVAGERGIKRLIGWGFLACIARLQFGYSCFSALSGIGTTAAVIFSFGKLVGALAVQEKSRKIDGFDPFASAQYLDW